MIYHSVYKIKYDTLQNIISESITLYIVLWTKNIQNYSIIIHNLFTNLGYNVSFYTIYHVSF